ncbi:ADP-ribose pyrophosphatase YjhB (NUDIX family) [Tamaricihabitans halophyticus]|uniref:ADP-ribose pyrophosphatase YjhB (NUDIX family) n=1 Tax=Tamaricihabitans halophyticus TaxID=1262583 RepID=A0A4R2QQ39_9PSEU|nr:CoA pyrophosphatase [Tamaricihabitans halophyticus]TCP50778.1 ADP-ribose pyrophosphatase YjhB (NUDIX family) [Tamaricihabitans halophyticus]
MGAASNEPGSDGVSAAAIRAALERFQPRTEALAGRRAAAVAIVVADGNGTRGVWLTRRSAGLRAHAGQIALPGGRIDDGEDAVGGALRELDEELGVALSQDAVLGRLDDYPTRSGYVITPVVLWAGAGWQPRPNPAEVARVALVPLPELDVPPRFLRIAESDRPVIQLPLLDTLVHAPTAAVLYQFREVALRGRHTRVAELEQPVFAWR